MMTENGFVIALEGLNELKKRGIVKDYAVGGGIAALRYTEPFFTNDLDVFIILPESSGKVVVITPVTDYFTKQGYPWLKEHVVIEGTPVQFLVASQLEAEAVRMASRRKFLGVWTRSFTPEYLIALMIKVGRFKDKERARMILEQSKVNREVLLDILSRYGLEQKFNGIIE